MEERRLELKKVKAEIREVDIKVIECECKVLELRGTIKTLENGAAKTQSSRSWKSIGMTAMGLTAVGVACVCPPAAAVAAPVTTA